MEVRTIELPIDAIQVSGGFALDIGGSVAKLIYRSKDDYENGVPKDKKVLESGKGKLSMIHMAREKIDEVIEYISKHCDISKPVGDSKTMIYSTGLGGNQFKEKIEGKLDVELNNLAEFDCFANAISIMLKEMPRSEIFKPVDKVGMEQGDVMLKMYSGVKEASEAGGQGSMADIKKNVEKKDDSEGHFPFMMAMLGSGFGFLQVEEDGTFKLIDGSNIGGRFFLGMTSFLTGVKDFSEIAALIEKSDGKTVDVFGSELVAKTGESNDIYSAMSADIRLFPFGKGLSDDSHKATKGDLIHSLLETICENTSQLLYQCCLQNKINRAYFVGNFVGTPKAQRFITRMMHIKQHVEPEAVDFQFIQNGGHMGALGSYLEPQVQKKRAARAAASTKEQ